ncbi:hypothetical protein AU191_06680 [Mycolicibacterium acapulense]|nr:hypothetical protein AU191_06680 [Mycolicibacterium acapulense]
MQLDDSFGTIARIRVSPAPGSEGTRLHINVAAALDGRDADKELDPELSLVEARIDGREQSAAGLNEILRLEHSKPVDVDLLVKRGAETTVLFDLDAERV